MSTKIFFIYFFFSVVEETQIEKVSVKNPVLGNLTAFIKVSKTDIKMTENRKKKNSVVMRNSNLSSKSTNLLTKIRKIQNFRGKFA